MAQKAKRKAAPKRKGAVKRKGVASKRMGRMPLKVGTKVGSKRTRSLRPTRKRKAKAGRWYADLGDLLKLKDTNHIGGLLQERAVSVFHGDAGTFKTFLALAIASCISYGFPLMEGGPRCKRGLSLYLAFEDVRGFKARRLAWLRFHQLPTKNLQIDAVKIINPYDEDIDDLPGLDFDLQDDAKVDRLIEYAQELVKQGSLPVKLIVIDVLREACGGIESTKTFRQAAKNAKKLAVALGCHVMLLHHNNKNSEKMRGPASLEGAIQQRFLVRRFVGGVIEILVMKNREGATGVSIVAKAHRIVMGIQRNKPPIESLAIELQSASEEELLEANAEKVLQLCAVFDADTHMTEGALLKKSGMSVTGSGGMQRKLLRSWIPPSATGIMVHNGGTDYRRFLREQVRGRWVYYCQSVDPAEGKAEIAEEGAKKNAPKIDPQVAAAMKRNAAKKKDGGGKKAAA